MLPTSRNQKILTSANGRRKGRQTRSTPWVAILSSFAGLNMCLVYFLSRHVDTPKDTLVMHSVPKLQTYRHKKPQSADLQSFAAISAEKHKRLVGDDIEKERQSVSGTSERVNESLESETGNGKTNESLASGFPKASLVDIVPEKEKRDKILLSTELPEKAKPFSLGNGNTTKSATTSDRIRADANEYLFDRKLAEDTLLRLGASRIRQVLTAYLEPPMNDTINGTGSQGDAENENDWGIPPEFVKPLPLRQTTPDSLHVFQYPRLQTCRDLPHMLPVDRGLHLDRKGRHIIRNVHNKKSITKPLAEAPFCPVEADPFLPWLHDVFPSIDGRHIHFIAQNKRRCNTGKDFLSDLRRLEPQVALMQPVAVQRIDEAHARNLAPELWYPSANATGDRNETNSYRYKLTSLEEADADAQFTRFICRFHGVNFSSPEDNNLQTVLLGETLSTYPFNYELVTYRKMRPTMLTPKGKDNSKFWLSNIRFDCPVPDSEQLHHLISSGETILSDGSPTLYVDVIPIRTSPRFGVQEIFANEDMIGPRSQWGKGDMSILWRSNDKEPVSGFNVTTRWGNRNVLPRVEASGRWENIPICLPPQATNSKEKEGGNPQTVPEKPVNAVAVNETGKQFDLVACLWASASFRTRGDARAVSDTLERLEEWIEFHLLVGFDHIYVYDNTGAHTNETSLAPTLEKYNEVTRIDWPFRVCNNNVPAHENTGERSSQYAAESSCRQRFGPFTEWLAHFDTDEYLVPMGKNKSLKDVAREAAKGGTNILTFRSTRAVPIANLSLPYHDNKECGKAENPVCITRDPNRTYLETYNCEPEGLPKPGWAQRAKKQLYRPDYVLSHFIHYSTVTRGILRTFNETPGKWYRSYEERRPSERFTNEQREAVMIHSKTTVEGDTRHWEKRCRHDFVETWKEKCRVGIPWPNNKESKEVTHDGTFKYNCFTNDKVSNYWIPRLREAMARRKRIA